MSDKKYNVRGTHAFTIVELLIVIVVVAILATIAVMAYNGITERATVSTLKSSLSNSSRILAADNATNGSYPVSSNDANNGAGLQPPAGTQYQYSFNSVSNSYCLTATATRGSKSYAYRVSNQTSIEEGSCSGHTALNPDLMQPLVTMHSYISAIAIDESGGYYLLSPYWFNPRVQILDPYHVETVRFATTGAGPDQLGSGNYSSWGIYVGPDNNVYVADGGNGYFKVYSKSGSFIRAIGLGTGTGDGNLTIPYGMVFDSDGDIWVADRGNNRIQKFSSTGTYLSKFGSAGSGAGQFNVPNGIAIDSQDNLYISDRSNHRIQKFNSSGTFLLQMGTGTAGNGDGQLNQPVFALVDPGNSDVYVYELVNMRISVFGSDGAFKRRFSTLPPGSTIQRSFSMAWEPNGDITLSTQDDTQGYDLVTFSKQGTFIRAH